LVAALIKQATAVFNTGFLHLLSDWPLYALIGAGGVSLALTQMAYRAGPLSKSMPALTVTDPAASVLLGALAFREKLAGTVGSLCLQVLGFLIMSAAAAQLARREAEDSRPRVAV
jgi:hypothetical protein